jgi:hypothetical protein
LTDDEKREQEFLKEKLAEEQKEEERKRAAVKHAQEKGASAREVGDPPPVVFNIQNIGGEHLDLFTGSVNLDGTPRWNPLGHIDPGDSRTFVGPIEGLKIKQGE